MLRDVRDEDLPIFFEHQRNPEAQRMAAMPPRQSDAFIKHWHSKILADSSVLKKAIVSDNSVVGNVLSWTERNERLVGFWIGREYWGRGIASRALSEFLLHEPIRPLCAYVAAHNRGSMRVLEKCGFVRAGAIHVSPDGVEECLFRLTSDSPRPTGA